MACHASLEVCGVGAAARGMPVVGLQLTTARVIMHRRD